MKISVEVLYTDGNIDQDATVAALSTELSKLATTRAAELAAVGPAVENYFDSHPGLRAPLPSISSLVASEMGSDPGSFAAVAETVADYIRANANGSGKDSFVIGRGRAAGGVARK